MHSFLDRNLGLDKITIGKAIGHFIQRVFQSSKLSLSTVIVGKIPQKKEAEYSKNFNFYDFLSAYIRQLDFLDRETLDKYAIIAIDIC